MTPTQRKYLITRLNQIAVEKQIEIVEKHNKKINDEKALSLITRDEFMQYLMSNPNFKGEPQDYLPAYILDLFDFKDIRAFLGKPEPKKYKTIYVRLIGKEHSVDAYEGVLDLLTPVEKALTKASDAIMLADSATANKVLEDFIDLQF